MNKAIRDKIIRSFETSSYKWRTARGIAKDTDLPMAEVLKFLERSSEVLRARKSNSKGQALYTSRAKYKSSTPISKRILDVVLNRSESDDV